MPTKVMTCLGKTMGTNSLPIFISLIMSLKGGVWLSTDCSLKFPVVFVCFVLFFAVVFVFKSPMFSNRMQRLGTDTLTPFLLLREGPVMILQQAARGKELRLRTAKSQRQRESSHSLRHRYLNQEKVQGEIY